MRTAAIGFTLLALAALPALPTGPVAHAMSFSCRSHHLRWAEHHNPADARVAITTEDGKVTLLLTDRAVAFQLSERTLHQVRRDLRHEEDDQENWLASAIVTAVTGTVRELIDNSFECRVRDLREVSYEFGRLEFTDRSGKPVFEDADLCDTDVLSSFSERDARKFIREFHRLKAERY